MLLNWLKQGSSAVLTVSGSQEKWKEWRRTHTQSRESHIRATVKAEWKDRTDCTEHVQGMAGPALFISYPSILSLLAVWCLAACWIKSHHPPSVLDMLWSWRCSGQLMEVGFTYGYWDWGCSGTVQVGAWARPSQSLISSQSLIYVLACYCGPVPFWVCGDRPLISWWLLWQIW